MRPHASHAFVGALLIAVGAALPAAAAVWTVDKAHSKISFDSAYGPTKFSGSFGAWSAAINFDPKNLPASKAVVTVDLASAVTGDDDRDQTLPTSDWFSTGKFPKATFTTTSIKMVGPDRYQAAAVLSLRGVSKPAVLNFTLKIVGNQATMNGQATLDRSQWGVGQGQFAEEKPVPHAVVVNVSLSAKGS
jgi:polyisoprenoid-binding protein YceI